MSEIAFINPKRRKSRGRKMPPGLKAYWAAKRNPSKKRRKKSAHSGGGKRRRSRRSSGGSSMSFKGIASRFTPSHLIRDTFKPAATAAGGALLLDVIWARLPLPEQVKSGPAQHLAKALGAVAMGALAEKVVGRKTANDFVAGAVTIVAYGVIKDLAKQAFPSLGLGVYDENDGLSYWQSGTNTGQLQDLRTVNAGMGVYAPQSMGVYAEETGY